MDENKQISFRRNYYTSDDSGKVFLVAIFSTFFLAFFISLVCGAIASAIGLEEGELSKQIWYLIPASLSAPIAFTATFFLYNKIAKIAFSAANIKVKIGWKNTLICILVALIALFGLQPFISCVDYVLGLIGYDLALLSVNTFGEFVLYTFLTALLPAICEELIFRGMVLSGLRKSLSDGKAIVLSALLFALMHGSLQQLIYPFILGMILAWVVVRTGSTFASMIVHFVNNFLVVLMAYISTVAGWSLDGVTSNWWFWIIAVVLLAIVGVALWLIDKFYFKSKNQSEVEKFEGSRLSLFVWIAIIVGIILLVLSIIMNFTVK